MRLFLGLALVVVLGAAAAHAAAYGEAGCGLGAVVMGKEGNQILAATTNGTFGNQTFAITTGTLNCGKDSTVAQAKEAEAFAEANYATLMRQVAAGKGEHLAGFATLAGCQPAAPVFSVAQASQTKIFVNDKTTPAEVVSNFRAVMAADPATAALCHG
jgi:hypothetical protein